MSDITIQQAIDGLKELVGLNDFFIEEQGVWYRDVLNFAINSLEVDEAYQLEYERMVPAKWQLINKNEINVIPQWKCSNCGAEFECFDMDFEYCPHCGSRMEDDDD